MDTKTKTKKSHNYSNQNPLEVVKGMGSAVGDSLVNDLLKGGVTDTWESLLGIRSEDKKHAGDLEEGQEINLKKKDKSEKERTRLRQ